MIEVCEAERNWALGIKLTDWSMARNLSNRFSGVQIPRDICTPLERYLNSVKCSWIIKLFIVYMFCLFTLATLVLV